MLPGFFLVWYYDFMVRTWGHRRLATVPCMGGTRLLTAKTSWLFQPQSGYPDCRQTGETVFMRGLLWC